VVKILWVVVSLVALVIYGFHQYQKDSLQKALDNAQWGYLILAIIALVAAKTLLAALSREGCRSSGASISFWDILTLYSLTQVGKYLPGGVWHFVSRGAAYRQRGLSATQIARSLILENLWMFSAAASVAAFGFLLFRFDVLPLPTWTMIPMAFIVVSLYPAVIVVSLIFNRSDFKWKTVVTLTLIGLLAWLAIGAAFYLVVLACSLGHTGFIFAVTSFAAAWCAGFVVPFVPGGIGLREFALIYLLQPALSEGEAFLASLLARLVWTGGESLMVLLMVWTSRYSRRNGDANNNSLE